MENDNHPDINSTAPEIDSPAVTLISPVIFIRELPGVVFKPEEE